MEKKGTKIAYFIALAIVVIALVIAKVTNDGSGFVATGWALFPPVVAIALALITKEVYSSLFIGIVVALALVSLYFPVRDLYVAKRSSDILAKQVEIREQYNDELQKSVDKLLSEEGIKDAASEDLGLVMPGEKRIEVQGLDGDSDASSSQKSSNAKKASEVAKEIEEVGKDAPWYIQALDMLFGFNGVEGQTVVSNGK